MEAITRSFEGFEMLNPEPQVWKYKDTAIVLRHIAWLDARWSYVKEGLCQVTP